jgi:hypothetical protein
MIGVSHCVPHGSVLWPFSSDFANVTGTVGGFANVLQVCAVECVLARSRYGESGSSCLRLHQVIILLGILNAQEGTDLTRFAVFRVSLVRCAQT